MSNQNPPLHTCTLDDFDWLPGLYSFGREDRITCESWARTPDGSYEGTGVTIHSGNRVEIEKMRIEIIENRGICFLADVPHNPSETIFELVAHSTANGLQFVFENPHHDFPQRVIYHYYPDDKKLDACIEGTHSGKFKTVEFPYIKRA